MQTVQVGATDRTTTQLGFGCSSLMGGLNRAESLAILEAAFAAGIRHFDVAPMYGFGQAESCLGEFLARHRHQVTITTKYGLPPPTRQGLVSFARSLARPVIHAVPGLKRTLTRAAVKATGAPAKASFTGTEARESLERSLRALQTDRIDIWLLHDAVLQDLHDDSLLRLMQDSVKAGVIGTFGVGSERAAIEEIAAERPEYVPVVQFAWSVRDRAVGPLGGFRVLHRAFAKHGAVRAQLADKARCLRWSAEAGADLADAEVLAALMLKAAVLENPNGVVLFSSKRPEHIRRNVDAAGDSTLDEPARRLRRMVQREIWNARAAG